jgi:hypothetical protein
MGRIPEFFSHVIRLADDDEMITLAQIYIIAKDTILTPRLNNHRNNYDKLVHSIKKGTIALFLLATYGYEGSIGAVTRIIFFC